MVRSAEKKNEGKENEEFPSWCSGNEYDWYPRRTQVRPLASLSGLRIRRCPELWCRSQMRLGSHVAVALA